MNKIKIDSFFYSIKTLGYYKIPNCISDPTLIARLIEDLDKAVEEDKRAIAAYDTYHFYDIVHLLLERGESFTEVLLNPILNLCAEKILSSTCIIHSYNAVKLMPSRENNATKIHRDCPRFYSQKYPFSLQALICLDKFTLDNGATYLLPGSHHVLKRPSDDFFYENAIRVVANPGDVIFFDSLVWHAGGENKTDQPRRGLTIVYTRSFMKQQIDLTRALSSEFIETLPEIGKKLVGMNVRVPGKLEEFYLPEEERLYRPNQG